MAKRKIHIDLVKLDQKLARLKRMASRLERIREHDTAQHAAWSSVIDEALVLVAHISRRPARNVHDLAIKLNATVWFLDKTDALLDAAGVQQLHAVAGDVRRLSRNNVATKP